MTRPPLVLAVGGTDSSGGAGLAADIAAVRVLGARAAIAVTAVTTQGRLGVRRIDRVGPRGVAAQIEAAAAGGRVRAWKTGMLVDAPTVRAVAAAGRRLPNLVVDPVLAASAGGRLLDGPGLRAMVRLLLPRAAVVTPNAAEAAALAGRAVRTVAEAVAAGRAILALGPRAVLVTGGHLPGRAVADVLVTRRGVRLLRARRLPGTRRGSGCALAAGVAAGLARGLPLEAAVRRARAYVRRTWASWP